jgi:xanthine dehydrogenase YagS FAD-binding subunit
MQHLAIDEPNAFKLLQPADLKEAILLALAAGGEAAFLAGGCDLLDQMKNQWRSPGVVVNLKSLPGLHGIRIEDNVIRIGALTTLASIAGDQSLHYLVPGVSQAAFRVATPQIRNLATVGGNLLQESRCVYYRAGWPCFRAGGGLCHAYIGINTEHAIFGGSSCYTVTPSDVATALVAVDAELLVQDRTGSRKMPVSELFVSPQTDVRHMHCLYHGEVLVEIHIPLKAARRSTFIKAARRGAGDFALASVAVALVLRNGIASDCRLVLGGVAPIPWRSTSAEDHLDGQALTKKVIDAAAVAAVSGARALTGNEYKVPLVKKLVVQALETLAHELV